MNKYLLFAFTVCFALALQSCGTQKKSRVDDDFYDFNTEAKKSADRTERKVKETKREVEQSADDYYQETKKEVENISQLPKPKGVRSRVESVDVVSGSVNPNAKYFIIMGSFSVQENAQRLANTLREKGFFPNILHSTNGLYRVSAYHFNEESAARVEIGQIRQNHQEYKDAWLLIKQ